jgi:carbon-monoxide dehydrogenase medium subunit
VLAGGTDLMRDLKRHRIFPRVIVDISKIPELRTISLDQGNLVIGACDTFTGIESSALVRRHARALAQAAASVGSPQIRNRGTLGGNIATASPAADTVPALLALGASVRIVSTDSARVIPVQDVLSGVHRNTLAEDEVISHVFIPVPPPGTTSAFVKLGRRRALAIARISVSLLIAMENGRVRMARMAFGAVAPNAFRAVGAEDALEGAPLTPTAVDVAVKAASAEVAVKLGDRASAPYKRDAVGALVRRAFEDVVSAQ